MANVPFCYRRLRSLGYSHRTALRLALWACDPEQTIHSENQ